MNIKYIAVILGLFLVTSNSYAAKCQDTGASALDLIYDLSPQQISRGVCMPYGNQMVVETNRLGCVGGPGPLVQTPYQYLEGLDIYFNPEAPTHHIQLTESGEGSSWCMSQPAVNWVWFIE